MTYRVLPDPRDLDEQGVQNVVAFCNANGIDPTVIPTKQGDPGIAFQIHGDTIRYRAYRMNEAGQVVISDERGDPELFHALVTGWLEAPLAVRPEMFGLSLPVVRAGV